MNKISTIFDRILYIIEKKGLKNVAELANILGYDKPQKIYRLKQEEDSKPSYDIIKDFSIKFKDLNLRWFITGEGEPFYTQEYGKKSSGNNIEEPVTAYRVSEEVQQLKERINELEIEKKSLLLALREFGAGLSQTPEKSVKSKHKKIE